MKSAQDEVTRLLDKSVKERKKRGRPSTGFDKKAYDAERMRRIRAGTWEPRPPQPNKYIPHIGAKQKAKKGAPHV